MNMIDVLRQVEINRLSEPYAECIDTSDGKHDFTRNVYEEIYPETLYSLEVPLVSFVVTFCQTCQGWERKMRENSGSKLEGSRAGWVLG